jgi:hypothetical protein
MKQSKLSSFFSTTFIMETKLWQKMDVKKKPGNYKLTMNM